MVVDPPVVRTEVTWALSYSGAFVAPVVEMPPLAGAVTVWGSVVCAPAETKRLG